MAGPFFDGIELSSDWYLRQMIDWAAPTGIKGPFGLKVMEVVGGKLAPVDSARSPAQRAAELLALASVAYFKLRDEARKEFQRSGNLQVVWDFVDGEPLALHDPWVREVLISALSRRDREVVKRFWQSFMPPKPKVRRTSSPQKAEEYYRWVIARVSEKILSGECTEVTKAVDELVTSGEAGKRRRLAGLQPEVGVDRELQIFYREMKRYVWRAMVISGLGLGSVGGDRMHSELSHGLPDMNSSQT